MTYAFKPLWKRSLLVSVSPAKPLMLLYIGVIALLLAGCGMGGEPRIVATAAPTALPDALVSLFSQPADLELGARVFAENCAACHGERGLGDGTSVTSGAIPSIVNLTDPGTLNVTVPEEYFAIITRGRLEKFMPPWGAILSDIERWAVANYVYDFRNVEKGAAEERSPSDS